MQLLTKHAGKTAAAVMKGNQSVHVSLICQFPSAKLGFVDFAFIAKESQDYLIICMHP